jgi:hypothetical protein
MIELSSFNFASSHVDLAEYLVEFQNLAIASDIVKVTIGNSKCLFLSKENLVGVATYFSSLISFEEKKEGAQDGGQVAIDVSGFCNDESALRKLLLRSQFEKLAFSVSWDLELTEIFSLFPLVEELDIQAKYRIWILKQLHLRLCQGGVTDTVVRWMVKTAAEGKSFEEIMAWFKWAIEKYTDPLKGIKRPALNKTVESTKDTKKLFSGLPSVMEVLVKLFVPAVWLQQCYERKQFVDIKEVTTHLDLSEISVADFERFNITSDDFPNLRPFVRQLLSFQDS